MTDLDPPSSIASRLVKLADLALVNGNRSIAERYIALAYQAFDQEAKVVSMQVRISKSQRNEKRVSLKKSKSPNKYAPKIENVKRYNK